MPTRIVIEKNSTLHPYIKMQHYLNLMTCLWYVHENNVLVTDSLAYLHSFLGLDVYNEQPVQQRLCGINKLVLHIDG